MTETAIYPTSRIYLIGMMGVGKSTIANLLSQRLEWTWIDTDACVERNSSMSVSDIFAVFGEEDFRKREWDCVQQTAKFKNIVVACGGGTPCFYHAMDFMLAAGTVIYLKANIDTLAIRIQQGEQRRPLTTNTEQPMIKLLEKLLVEREPVYRRAQHVIETDGLTDQEVAEQVMKAFEKVVL